MGHQTPKNIGGKGVAKVVPLAPQRAAALAQPLAPLRAGTGTASLSPPWARDQVNWLGEGYYVLRLAADESSRWLLGARYRWGDVFVHERTFRRSAVDKSTLIANLKMNPWPVHLAAAVDPIGWRKELASIVEDRSPVLDTGYTTLWQVSLPPMAFASAQSLVVLDGHHSRKAQQYLGLERVFGWVEPLESKQLSVRAIERAGWLAKWLEAGLKSGDFRKLNRPPEASSWSIDRSMAFEVVQADKRWWCEVARPLQGECAVDALSRLGKGQVHFKAGANFDEIMGWLERLEIDTALRMPPPTKGFVRARALARKPLPQKATYFYPKIPFGILVEDLA